MKINSVKIDREVVQLVFIDRGIEPSIAETKFPNPDDFNGKSLYKSALSALKRNIRKQLPQSAGAKKDFLESCGGKVESRFIESSHPEWVRVDRMLRGVTKEKARLAETPLLLWTSADGREPSYVPVDATVKPNFHGSFRAFTNDKPGSTYLRFFDFVTLAAERLLAREIRQFAAQYPERVRTAIFKCFTIEDEFIPSIVDNEQLLRYLMDRAVEQTYSIYRGFRYSSLSTKKLLPLYEGDVSVLEEDQPGASTLIKIILPEYLRFVGSLQAKAVDRSLESFEYAKAFDTKKHIPRKHRAAMEDNVFLEAHGYVELDGDVDLEKFSIIEENFEELRMLFPYPKDVTNSFRIKKLGNYRAAGIYFPSRNTTIFDVNHPSSFVHELFHQLDYTYGKSQFAYGQESVHETAAFRRVFDYYVMLVKRNVEALPADDPFKAVWNGSTKFNRDYFLKESEVFARLGELLIAILGRYNENSLYKSVEELTAVWNRAVYPIDEKLMMLTHEYFRDAFPFLKLQKREGTSA